MLPRCSRLMIRFGVIVADFELLQRAALVVHVADDRGCTVLAAAGA